MHEALDKRENVFIWTFIRDTILIESISNVFSENYANYSFCEFVLVT